MTESTLRLLFLRLSGILVQGFLLVAATVLFVFGMLEVFQILALLALATTWLGFRPPTARALARHEYTAHDVKSSGDGITAAQYASLRAILTRFHLRRRLHITRDRFDGAQAILTTLVWAAYLGFYSSVALNAA